jgi:hypothetical protein
VQVQVGKRRAHVPGHLLLPSPAYWARVLGPQVLVGILWTITTLLFSLNLARRTDRRRTSGARCAGLVHAFGAYR